MSKDLILKVENLSKQYRLGVIGTGTLSHDLNRWWHLVRGKEDPYLKIGETNIRDKKGNSQYVWALKDINFEVERGEVLGIIGKNGAGKSTLLKILSRVTLPTTGRVLSKGRIASLLEVGTGFHPEMTGRENIYLNGAILGMTKREIARKFDEIVAFAGVERYVDTPVKRYSSGMKVRLAFAVAAHLEPDILVVDEVLAVGDAEFQKKAIGKMQDISGADGRTVLFVSHDMAAIQNLCSRLIVLEDGQKTYEGDVIKGIDYYLSHSVTTDYTDLLSIKNRKGDGTARFKSISFTSEWEGKLYPGKILSGAKLFIDIEIENYLNIDRSVCVSIDIADASGIPVSNVSNQFNKKELKLFKNANTIIRYEIDNFNLRSMDYTLSLWGAELFGGTFDFIDSEIKVHVTETDFFKTGAVPRGVKHGYLLLKNSCYNV